MEWTALESETPRMFHSMLYYTPRNSLLLFGGAMEENNGLLEYSIGTGKWQKLACVNGWGIKGKHEAFIMEMVRKYVKLLA